ncbi:MAG TPA: hypothetical protein VN521_01090 [Negativicutes bacterium]|nr:hypothetical protein [Negativicutes bacterium]
MAAISWLAIFPYAYIAFFLGGLVGDNAKTPQAAAVLFWAYLALYPAAVVVGNTLSWVLRRAGKRGRALAMSLLPYGVLAVVWVFFASFVKVLCTAFA